MDAKQVIERLQQAEMPWSDHSGHIDAIGTVEQWSRLLEGVPLDEVEEHVLYGITDYTLRLDTPTLHPDQLLLLRDCIVNRLFRRLRGGDS